MKSLTAVVVAGRLFLSNKAKRVLVVAPLPMLNVWMDEFKRYANYDYELTVLSGTGAKKASALRNPSSLDKLQVMVVNHESAWRLESGLLAWKPDAIIADEGHKIKPRSTKASKAMAKIGTVAQYRLLLTGTLVMNHTKDVYYL